MTNNYLVKKVFHSYLFMSIMATMAATIGMLVDGVVIGQFLGADCVSAQGLASPVFILITAVAGVFCNGGTSCCSNHLGRGEKGKICLNFTVTSLGALVIGIFVTGVLLFFGDGIAVMLGAQGELVSYTGDYVRGLGVGGVFIMLSQVIMYYIRLDNDSGLSFISVVIMTVFNIAMDLVFTLVFHMGMFGMGLATALSYGICLLVCFIHFVKKENILKLTFPKGGLKEFADVIVTGFPSALNRACMTIRGISLNHLLMTLGGSLAVSALTVQNNINQLLSSVTMGVGMTTMLIAGIFYGERDEKSLEKTLKISLRSGVLLSLVVAVATFIFARPLVGMFMKDEAGAELAVRALRFFCLSLPFSLSCVVLLNFYQCTKRLFLANLICLSHGLLFVVAISFGLSGFMGTDGVWISFLGAELLSLAVVVVAVRLKSGKWPTSFAQMMMLSKDFVPEEEHILDLSLKNDMAMVMELSNRVSEFCRLYSEDTGKIDKLSLCIEEMAGNIVQHGFQDKKEHSIDIRIIITEEAFIFRIRDDGIRFNPIRYADENERTDAMGIKLVQKIALDIDYNYTIGLNNLTISL